MLDWQCGRNTNQFRERYRSDPNFALKERLRNQLRKKAKLFPRIDDLMRGALMRNGRSNVVERACGYTIAQLAQHLESLFIAGMDWDAFSRGEIHIDHRRPQCTFDLNDPLEVSACWALTNLQPLWARDNQTKSDPLPDGGGSAGASAEAGSPRRKKQRLPPGL